MGFNLLGLASGLLAVTSAHSPSLGGRAAVGPPPLVIPPSQVWEGNDGSWSTFWLGVGTPPQTVRVLPSTANNQPWVVLPEGCSSTDPPECANNRGGIFRTNSSSSWYVPSWIKNETSAVFSVAIESNLGLTGDAQYGYDNASLGADSGTPSVSNQVIGGVATKDFFLGLFGLNPSGTSFSGSADPVQSYMSTLKNQSIIPSLSYGYTAGNKNRDAQSYGSLVLGGYDTTLFEPNQLNVAFNSHPISDLTININKISSSSSKNGNQALSSTPFAALVDSTVSQLYLPVDVCKQFESAFGLVFDDASGLYLVNDALHTQLLAQSPTITFTITNSTSKVTVDIALPYSAFDLTAQWPLVPNGTQHYFPLKRAANDTQITLGRAFLQEAYLIADYERSTFSLSQRKWNANNPPPTIQAILPLSSTPAAPNTKKSVSIAAVVASAVGGVALITIIAGTVFFVRRKNQKRKTNKDSTGTLGSILPGKGASSSVGYSISPSIAFPMSPSAASGFTPPDRAQSPSLYEEDHAASDGIRRSSGLDDGHAPYGSVAGSSVRYPPSEFDMRTTHSRSTEFDGGLGPYRSMASSPGYYPSDYESQIMRTRSPELEGSPALPYSNLASTSSQHLGVRGIQRYNTRSPELEGSPASPLVAHNQLRQQSESREAELQPPVELQPVELPARETVDKTLLDFKTTPQWI